MSLDLSLSVFSELGLPTIALVALITFGLLVSAYVKIVTVLAILRAGLGFLSLPSALVAGTLAFSLTLLVMAPTWNASMNKMDQELSAADGPNKAASRLKALGKGIESWQLFLKRHAREKEVSSFSLLAAKLEGVDLSTEEARKSVVSDYRDQIRVLAPAFLVSELRAAFSIGLLVLLPLLLIDLLTAFTLTALGLSQTNPHLVSLPLKLLLFVAVDGWTLVTTNLVASYAI